MPCHLLFLGLKAARSSQPCPALQGLLGGVMDRQSRRKMGSGLSSVLALLPLSCVIPATTLNFFELHLTNVRRVRDNIPKCLHSVPGIRHALAGVNTLPPLCLSFPIQPFQPVASAVKNLY